MNVLIIGMGFAGNMYQQVLSHLKKYDNYSLNIAYHSKSRNNFSIKYYPTLKTALKKHNPSLIIVTVNDVYHLEILNELKDFKGTILCEKPLVANQEQLNIIKDSLSNETNLILSTVIRFSRASQKLKEFLKNRKTSIKKIKFVWKKNRINDYRPTVGVVSEVIHPLDTIQWLLNKRINIQNTLTTSSNYSIDRNKKTLDSVFILGETDDKEVISGYSSFISLQVERSIEIVLKDLELDTHFFITLTFDKDEWFSDKLIIFQENQEGYKELINFNSMNIKTNYSKKLERTLLMIKSILNNKMESTNLCLKEDTFSIQSLLNDISKNEPKNEIDYDFSSKDILKKNSTTFDRIG
ncbi:Gfo/Idh/MocA family oxidoreductase [Staphylococcus epidermidis]|nr:Gfo/Idh/MocA family oxidoreductase [Staphylococcus epidermidis]